MPNKKPEPKAGKGKVLGMPYWAAGLALLAGLVVGYYLLKRSGGTSSGGTVLDQSQKPQQSDQGGGTGGIPYFPTNTMQALGLTPTEPTANNPSGDASQPSSPSQPSAADTFSASSNYAHTQFGQGGTPLNQAAVRYAHAQFSAPIVTPVAYSPTNLLYTGHGNQ